MLSFERSSVRVRKGKVDDAEGLARVFYDAWRLAYAGIIPEPHLSMMIDRRGAEWWRKAIRSRERLLVVEVCGILAGYATFGPARSRGRFEGEIYEIYLDPAHQGLGFGAHLFEASRHALDMERLNGLIIWALSENAGAADFYRRRGGRPVARILDRIGGKKLEKIAFSWE